MATISDAFISDYEFKELGYGLGLKSDKILSLQKKDDRVYLALREWCKAIHTVDEFIQVLRKIGYNNLIAKLGFAEQNISAPGGIVVGSFSGGSITVNNSHLPHPALSPSYPAFYTPDNDFNADELTLHNREFDGRGVSVAQCPTFNGDFDGGNPFDFTEKKDETMSTFVNSNSPFYTKLCSIMDEGADWKTLAKNYGVLNNPAAAKLVLDLSAGWEKRQVHPTDRIFKLLIATPHGKRTLDQLSDDLSRIDNPQIAKWVSEWNDFRQKQDTAVKDTNTSIYNANVELRKFLLQHKISKTENVDLHLSRLTKDSVGVSEPEHLKMMEYSDFIAAGFNIIESKMFVKAIATL